MRYDKDVIHEVASRLYSRASTTHALTTIFAAIVGLVLGAYVAHDSDAAIFVAVIAGVLFGAIGYYIGEQRALMLRFLAQQALCQAEIEEHLKAMKPAAPPVFPQGPPRRAPNMTPGMFEGR